MPVQQKIWENPQRPDTSSGPRPLCPRCGAPLVGPFSAYDENNQNIQKTACSQQGCTYVARIVYGFQSMKDADTLTFR